MAFGRAILYIYIYSIVKFKIIPNWIKNNKTTNQKMVVFTCVYQHLTTRNPMQNDVLSHISCQDAIGPTFFLLADQRIPCRKFLARTATGDAVRSRVSLASASSEIWHPLKGSSQSCENPACDHCDHLHSLIPKRRETVQNGHMRTPQLRNHLQLRRITKISYHPDLLKSGTQILMHHKSTGLSSCPKCILVRKESSLPFMIVNHGSVRL